MSQEQDLEAEMLRQSHCERKHMSHACVGVMTVNRVGVRLDCEICGCDMETLENVSDVMERAKALCAITGVEFHNLCRGKQRELLLEVAAMLTGR
jgi:hypothetical protein